jgi:hypothetical protein
MPEAVAEGEQPTAVIAREDSIVLVEASSAS